MTIRAEINTARLKSQLQKLIAAAPKQTQYGAAARAFTRAGQTIGKESRDEVRSELNLPSTAIRDRMKIHRPRTGPPGVEARISAAGMPLIAFTGTRQLKRGVSVKVKRKGSRKVIGSAFIADVQGRSGFQTNVHRGVFARKFKGAKRVGRLPIEQLFSSRPSDVLREQRRARRILEAGADRFERDYRRELRRRLGLL